MGVGYLGKENVEDRNERVPCKGWTFVFGLCLFFWLLLSRKHIFLSLHGFIGHVNNTKRAWKK